MLAFLNSGQSSTLISPDAVNSGGLAIRRHARYRTMVISRYLGTAKSLLLLVFTRIVGGIQVFEAQRTNGRYLGDVLTGFGPVEVGGIAGQNDDATGWKTWLVGSNHCGPTHLNAATSGSPGRTAQSDPLGYRARNGPPRARGLRPSARRGDRPPVRKARRTGRTSPRGRAAEAAARASKPATLGRRRRWYGSRRRGRSECRPGRAG